MIFKRHVMQINLESKIINWKTWPPEYRWIPWNQSLLEPMAELAFMALSPTTDAILFPRFKTRESCKESVARMMTQSNFFALASGIMELPNRIYVGGIIGAILEDHTGWIQNQFVDPEKHGHGFGSFLTEHLLMAFLQNGITQVGFHVTATNTSSIRLYSRYGFEIVETIEMTPREY